MDIYVKAEKTGQWLHDDIEGGIYLVKIFVPTSGFIKDVRKELEVKLDNNELDAALSIAEKLNQKNLGFQLKIKIVNDAE